MNESGKADSHFFDGVLASDQGGDEGADLMDNELICDCGVSVRKIGEVALLADLLMDVPLLIDNCTTYIGATNVYGENFVAQCGVPVISPR